MDQHLRPKKLGTFSNWKERYSPDKSSRTSALYRPNTDTNGRFEYQRSAAASVSDYQPIADYQPITGYQPVNDYQPVSDYQPDKYSDGVTHHNGNLNGTDELEASYDDPYFKKFVSWNYPASRLNTVTANGYFESALKRNSLKDVSQRSANTEIRDERTRRAALDSLRLNTAAEPPEEVLSSSVGLTSPESENSQVSTSISTLSNSIETTFGADPSLSLQRSLHEMTLAQQHFPVTLGGANIKPQNSNGLASDGQHQSANFSKHSHRSRSGSHRRHRPGSGLSSSSSNSKSSIDKLYLMASDATGNGGNAVLASTPYQAHLAKLHIDQLRIEEERIYHLKIRAETERQRGPAPNWYEIKTSRFHYEARKNNEHLKLRSDGTQKTKLG